DDKRHSNNWEMIGRLKAGATLEQAQAQLDALNAANMERFPQFREILQNAGFRTKVVGLQDQIVRDVRATLYLLWGASFSCCSSGLWSSAGEIFRLILREGALILGVGF